MVAREAGRPAGGQIGWGFAPAGEARMRRAGLPQSWAASAQIVLWGCRRVVRATRAARFVEHGLLHIIPPTRSFSACSARWEIRRHWLNLQRNVREWEIRQHAESTVQCERVWLELTVIFPLAKSCRISQPQGFCFSLFPLSSAAWRWTRCSLSLVTKGQRLQHSSAKWIGSWRGEASVCCVLYMKL